MKKSNKNSITKASVEYIQMLEKQLEKQKQLDIKFKEMAMMNKQLVDRIKVNIISKNKKLIFNK
jgi:predicted transcriptional regulator